MPRRSSTKVHVARVLGLAAVYYGAAKLGLELAFATTSVTAIWPPTGIALAALVLWGPRMWPGVALGAFAANLGTGIPLYAVAGITIGNTLEALVGAFLLVGLAGFRPSLERVRDVIALVVLAAGLSTMVSATIGVTSLLAAGEISGSDFGSVWRTWWVGDMGGDLIVATALMVAATHWPFNRAPGRPLEAVVLAVATGAITAFVFTQEQGITYLIFPFLIWAVLRFWQPGAVGASLVVASIAVPLTDRDLGPFAGASPDDRLLLAQTFVGVAGISALVLAAVVTERRRAEQEAEEIADTLQESLLPSHLPHVPGIDVSASFRPAGERHSVGGDFYDMFQNADGSWALVVGDVVGKGCSRCGAYQPGPLHPACRRRHRARAQPRPGAAEQRDPAPVPQRLLHGGLRTPRGRAHTGGKDDALERGAPDAPRLALIGSGRGGGQVRDAAGGDRGAEARRPRARAEARGRAHPLHRWPHRRPRAAPDRHRAPADRPAQGLRWAAGGRDRGPDPGDAGGRGRRRAARRHRRARRTRSVAPRRPR